VSGLDAGGDIVLCMPQRMLLKTGNGSNTLNLVWLAQIKTEQVLRDITVIIVSAEHDSKSVVKGIKQGAEDYLTKLVNAGLLVKKVKEYLG